MLSISFTQIFVDTGTPTIHVRTSITIQIKIQLLEYTFCEVRLCKNSLALKFLVLIQWAILFFFFTKYNIGHLKTNRSSTRISYKIYASRIQLAITEIKE